MNGLNKEIRRRQEILAPPLNSWLTILQELRPEA
jgi:hypothetical protein